MLDPRLAGLNAISCPHPNALRKHAILVQGRRPMALCANCYAGIRDIVGHWHDYQMRPSTVFRGMRALGYNRADSLRFLIQLIADRAQVRIGLLSRGRVDV